VNEANLLGSSSAFPLPFRQAGEADIQPRMPPEVRWRSFAWARAREAFTGTRLGNPNRPTDEPLPAGAGVDQRIIDDPLPLC
jgi:hypothetical protein